MNVRLLIDAVVRQTMVFRERMSALRTKLDEYNRARPERKPKLRVVAYYGQSVVEDDDEEGTSSDVV